MSTIQYAENFIVKICPVKRHGVILDLAPGQGQSGYGNRIATDRMIRFNDDKRSRWYRVYAICWSNAASHYVIRQGVQLFCRGTDLEITS